MNIKNMIFIISILVTYSAVAVDEQYVLNVKHDLKPITLRHYTKSQLDALNYLLQGLHYFKVMTREIGRSIADKAETDSARALIEAEKLWPVTDDVFRTFRVGRDRAGDEARKNMKEAHASLHEERKAVHQALNDAEDKYYAVLYTMLSKIPEFNMTITTGSDKGKTFERP